MAIKIVVSDSLKFPVKGTIKDKDGSDQPFSFSLICKRLDTDEIGDRLKPENEASVPDFLVDVAEGWEGVRDEDDKPMPYSADALRQLCRIPGVAALAFRTYLAEVGAKEKN